MTDVYADVDDDFYGSLDATSCSKYYAAWVEHVTDYIENSNDIVDDDVESYTVDELKADHTSCKELNGGGSERGTCNNRRRDRKDDHCAALKETLEAAETVATQADELAENMSPAVSVSASGVAAAAAVAVAALLF